MSPPLIVVCPHCHAQNRVPADRLADGGTCGRCKQRLFMGHPVALTSADFDRHIAQSDLPVVVDFWAPWCGPCRMMAPAFEQASRLLEPDVRLAKVNTEQEPELASRHGIRSIPTLAIFRHGREIARQAGAMETSALVAWIRNNIKRSS